jgi:hypothetical protein
VGLERGPLSLLSKIEEPLERKSSGSSLENREYWCRGSAALTVLHHLSAEVGTNFANKRWSLGRTQATELVCFVFGLDGTSNYYKETLANECCCQASIYKDQMSYPIRLRWSLTLYFCACWRL